ncbi:hypothetical protein TwortDSMZ_184 [Staphylococcus phage Twort]|uniref:ORF084 n=2 Tax=Staphylococcus phage Twort (strain DSM 17442 / HER 48) TaxID=2908167 RepID=Q4Z963_BPTWO|nr:ORF084 [Staphylococcus phage Twort]AAX92378.1 ORF084 [Staphylococcus phage Twort]QIW89180.1 hypothetical protein TwortDSMZ_184 [Staphylococcus phage Twort]
MSKLDLLKDIDIVEYLEERDVVEGVVGKHNVTVRKVLDSEYVITVEGVKYEKVEGFDLLVELYQIKYFTKEDMNKKLEKISSDIQKVKLEKELREELNSLLKGIEENLVHIKALLLTSEEQGYTQNLFKLNTGYESIKIMNDIIKFIKHK